MRKYKVWVQVEECDDENDTYNSDYEPECLAQFDNEEDALEFIGSIRRGEGAF